MKRGYFFKPLLSLVLEELGYGLLSKADISSQDKILPDKYYRFMHEQGFILSELPDPSHANSNIFLGSNLHDYVNEDWQNEESLRDAKRLTRLILAPLLGARPIHSRKLFV